MGRLSRAAFLIGASALAALEPGAQPVVHSVYPNPTAGSNTGQWMTLRGEGFGPSFNARVQTEDADATVADPRNLRYVSASEVQVFVITGIEAAEWTATVVVPGHAPSAAAPFRVLPPPPTIEAAALSGRPGGDYALTVLGPHMAKYSEVLWDGERVAAEPLFTSEYSSALTLGFRATVPRARVRARRAHEVRIRTRAPGGGTSAPYRIAPPPVPLTAEPAFWALGLVGGVALGGTFHYVRLRRARRERAHQTRRQIADDLHDDVGSRLGGLALGLDVAARTLPAEARAEVQARADEARALLGDLRDVVWVVDGGFDTVRDLADRVLQTAEALLPDGAAAVRVEGDGALALDLPARRHLLFFCKEALHNASRHGAPATVSIAFAAGEGAPLTVEVTDDGRGFETDTPGGRGLASFERRAQALGGTVTVASAQGDGTRITLSVPQDRVIAR